MILRCSTQSAPPVVAQPPTGSLQRWNAIKVRLKIQSATDFLLSFSYYLPADPPVAGQTVLVYLEGGGACFNAASCKQRCEVGSPKAYRCTQHRAKVKNLTGNIWSGSEEENPGLWSSYKVFVPYCTSDVFSGRRDPDEDSAGFSFHGRYVVEAVVDDLLTEVLKNFELTQFVFMGASAGKIHCL